MGTALIQQKLGGWGMSSEWPIVPVGELAAKTPGALAVGPFGSRMKADLYVPSGVRVVRGNNLGTGLEFKGDFVHVPPDVADGLASCCLVPGDLVFPHRGNIGEVGITPDDEHRYMLSTSLMKLSPDRTRVDPLFLTYFFKSSIGRAALLMNASQVGTPGIATPLKSLRSIELPLPTLAEQQVISQLLSELDRRITLLRETNATLEAIAQALFKSWFVDFDPVHAKMAGRAPEGMEEATAALFPGSLEETALGLVPTGWTHKPIIEVVEGVYDGPHATPPEADSGGVFLGIKNLTGTALDLTEIRYIGEADWAKWTKRVEPCAGDIVFSYEATLGFFALVPPDLRCCLGRRLALIRPKATNGAGHFWFHQLVAEPFQRLLAKHTIQGATVNRIALKEFPSYPVLTPPVGLQMAFDQVAAAIWAKIHSNQAQSQVLAQSRNTLLPRLISGQLRLPEAQAQLEAAA